MKKKILLLLLLLAIIGVNVAPAFAQKGVIWFKFEGCRDIGGIECVETNLDTYRH